MLREICCSEFYQKKIVFTDGLNVVLGTDSGDNSIGKSSFLLIIDFVLGGDTYANSPDILNNVKSHDINFSFIKNRELFYFSRKNTDPNVVWKCDNNYNKILQISIKEYRDWLNNFYNLNLPNLSFRDAVGRYTRVYGKKNCDEKHPLHYFPKEADMDAAYVLLKLFNEYTPISVISNQTEDAKNKLKAYKKAQTLDFISKIGKREYIANLKELERMKKELEVLAINIEKGIADSDSIITEKAIEIKKSLFKVRKMRSSIISRLNSLDENYNYKFAITNDNLYEIKEFFPNINCKKLEEIEKFHYSISNIFKDEIKQERTALASELNELDNQIKSYVDELQSLIQNPNTSKVILKQHSDLVKKIEKIQKENEAYLKQHSLEEIKCQTEEKLIKIERRQFDLLASKLNNKMHEINDYIYKGMFNSPIISFDSKTYQFFTPNDTGTGVAFKGLVVFDLAVLLLTSLPLLVHDSLLLKQISDVAIEQILKLYESCGKQVFIAFDKLSSYTKESASILLKNKVLELAPNGKELFGRSWG
ncbi:MAG: DUF2326 domain-containing protein [Roseburia sp.]|nr:DUF2326 domain-containing protein [Anaeroplasma bactoclasticum]MCM1196496.1 DUF2326 domain-containing protein [Roseburia sp.]MCM1556957.1 DUF2326 domain-containing protein [Anaeroplasma bactoclasticum]